MLLSFLIGPVFFVLLETSIKKGAKHAILIDIGVLLSDVLYLLTAYFFAETITEKLADYNVSVTAYSVIPDDVVQIQEKAKLYQSQGVDLILYTGGTGLSKRDVTPEALIPLFDRRIPGIEETIRAYGQERVPYSMLSRSVAGVMNDSLLITLPGSVKGVKESMDAIFPAVLHVFKVIKGERHD